MDVHEEDPAPPGRPAPPRVTVVTAPDCHLCADAQEVLARFAGVHGLRVQVVDGDSAQGRQLTAAHRPAVSPLVLLDGQFFSQGRLPRRKLEQVLRARGILPAPAVRPGRRRAGTVA